MEPGRERLQYLFKQAVSKRSTPEELDEFWEIINTLQGDDDLRNELTLLWETDNENRLAKHPDWDNMLEKIKARAADYEFEEDRSTGRVTGLRWLKYAAAAIIIFGIGSYLYINNQKEKPSVAQVNPLPVQNDVAPGGNRAVLTLANGTTIILDSAAKGTLAREGNTTIVKTGEGTIEYNAEVKPGNAFLYNTMTTPRGGQYQLTLPDGTQVWLNAASSITYPTAFSGKTRDVSISGEVYFEVAKNKKQPFIVTAGKQTIEVLGTHFNVNAYADESTLNTTLLEGSVRIKTVHTSLTLKPGQQGQLTDRGLVLAAHPDLEQVMAWKSGLFNFNGKSLEESLMQLARWYDVEIVFEGKKPSIKLAGTIGRSLTLSQVLKGLAAMELKTRLEASARKLVILE